MIRTSVYLDEGSKRGLERLARDTGRSEAALIREAVAALLAARERPRPTLPLFRSDDPTIAERVDEILREEGFGTT